MKRFYFFLNLALALFISTAFATTYRQLSLAEMLEKADLAFYGIVISVEPIEQDDGLWTQVGFELLEPFKGFEEASAALELKFYGGIPLDGAAFQINLMPQFSVGETVLILAYKDNFYSPIVGFRQGLWREQDGVLLSETGQRLSLGEEGELVLEGAGASVEDIFAALHTVLEAQE